MKKPKSVRESISKEKLHQAEQMIESTENYILKRLMKTILSMSYDDLDFIEQILDSMTDDSSC